MVKERALVRRMLEAVADMLEKSAVTESRDTARARAVSVNALVRLRVRFV